MNVAHEDNMSYLVVDDLPDDLLDAPSDAVKRVVKTPFERESAERAVAPTTRWKLAVHQSTQLVLRVLYQTVRGTNVGWVSEQVFLRVELDPAAAHGLVPYYFIVHSAVRDKRKISTKTTK